MTDLGLRRFIFVPQVAQADDELAPGARQVQGDVEVEDELGEDCGVLGQVAISVDRPFAFERPRIGDDRGRFVGFLAGPNNMTTNS